MTNYLYELSCLEQNHETFANQRQVTSAAGVRKQAQSFQSSEVLQKPQSALRRAFSSGP